VLWLIAAASIVATAKGTTDLADVSTLALGALWLAAIGSFAAGCWRRGRTLAHRLRD
jgi:hypothetical protein